MEKLYAVKNVFDSLASNQAYIDFEHSRANPADFLLLP